MKILKRVVNGLLTNKLTKSVFNLFITPSTIKFFNSIYESSPTFFLELFVRMFKQPDFDYTWNIKLPNGKKVKMEVRKNYFPSWEFSLSYKWHDRALKEAETKLNDYFSKEFYYFDIGANHGLRSLYSLSMGRPTILFEPNLYLRSFTENIFKANGFSNYKIENLCLSNVNCTAKFFLSENSYESSLKFSEDMGNVKEIEVDVITLDKYLENNPLKSKVKIIKIDVEGNEIEVIKGMEQTLIENEPVLLVEILDNTNKEKLFNHFKDIGYSMYTLRNFPSIKINEIKTSSEIYTSHEINAATNFLFTKENSLFY